jgi:hypothetical protein
VAQEVPVALEDELDLGIVDVRIVVDRPVDAEFMVGFGAVVDPAGQV